MGSIERDFRAIYRVLKHLEASMDCTELDTEGLSAAALGVSEERLEKLLILMQEEGYIRGLVITQGISDDFPRIAEPVKPRITLSGLEYLAENSFMRRAANLAKGIKDIVPGGCEQE